MYSAELIVSPQTIFLPPSDLPATLQVICKTGNEPPRKCADDWTVDRDDTHLDLTINLEIPGGWSEVTLQDEGTPVMKAFVGIPSGYLRRYQSERTYTNIDGRIVDAHVEYLNKPRLSNGLIPRVIGYYSDGSAEVEMFAGIGTIRPTDTFICLRENEPETTCDAHMSLMPSGKHTRIQSRLPFGKTFVSVTRNGQSVLIARVTVSERILGIDPDVMDCITDTSLQDNGLGGTGCSGWYDPVIRTWDPNEPLRVKLIGPTPWTTFFVETLTALEPLLNINFEWVQDDQGAHVKAIIGITREDSLEQELACSIEPISAGCATLGIPREPDDSHHIVIYNIHTDSEELPTAETDLNFLRQTIVHEAIHAFTGIEHRREPGSIMQPGYSEFYTRRTTPSPMDTALINLRSHPNFGRGMTFHEIEHLVVPHDELLDADTEPVEPSPGFFAWKAVYAAFQKIRDTATATYEINTTMPDCQQQISGGTYQVAKLRPGSREFQWSRLESNELSALRILSSNSEIERWQLTGSTWQTVNNSLESHGWVPELSDPYNLLVDILVRADWSQISMDKQGNKSIVSATEAAFPTGSERGGFRLTIDNNTHAITDYQLNWTRSHNGCDGYIVTATNGTYSDRFTFPTTVRAESDLLSGCETTTLPTNPRAHRVDGRWHQECPTQMATTEYSNTHRFNTHAWSLLRIDFQTQDDAIINFVNLSTSEAQTLSPSQGRISPDGLEGYQHRITDVNPSTFGLPVFGSYIWHHQWLPPGQYEIQAATRERAFHGRYALIVDTQPIPGPPKSLRFKTVATSNDRTCALLTDGTPLCWGKPYDTRPQPSIPEGPFESIYGGFHFCATTAEGNAQCWDFAEAGDHDCNPVDGDTVARYCYLVNQPETSDNEGLIDKSSAYVPAWYYDQTPPQGEVFIKLTPGRDQTCGIREDRTAYCWGDSYAREGKPPDDTKFVDIASGHTFSCGITTDAGMQCWGGSEWDINRNKPPNDGFTSIRSTASYEFNRTCGINGAGLVTCVGVPEFCVLNAASARPCSRIRFDENPNYWYDQDNPTPYNPASGHTFAALSTEAPECGIKADGTALCWHPWGSVGSPAPTETFTQISAGTRHVCGLRTDATIACWGDNFYGQATPPNGDHIQTSPSIQPQYTDLVASR